MQNCVCTNWAPAATLAASFVRLPARRRIDRHVGGADEECAPCRRPCARSAARRRRAAARAVSISVVESMSNTGLVSGWSPAFGIVAGEHQHVADAERRRAHQFALQRDAVAVAAGRSAGSARCRSAIEDRRGRECAPYARARSAPSVTLTASARPRSGAALRSRSCGSQETGGATSAVMTKRPARSRSFEVCGGAGVALVRFVHAGLRPLAAA